MLIQHDMTLFYKVRVLTDKCGNCSVNLVYVIQGIRDAIIHLNLGFKYQRQLYLTNFMRRMILHHVTVKCVYFMIFLRSISTPYF